MKWTQSHCGGSATNLKHAGSIIQHSNNYYSFIKLNPETGRKHQLRKQLLIRGYPILGDNKYKFDSVGKNKKSNLMLHSYKINFSINNIKYKYVAELTDIFKKTLNEKYLKNYQQ